MIKIKHRPERRQDEDNYPFTQIKFPVECNSLNNSGLLYSFWWLVLGGIFYTIGGIIYGLKIPKTKFKQFGFHEIFHIFVMLGSFCHYWFVLNYVIKV